MIAAEVRTRTVAAGEHIRLVQSLGCELERAMQAIASNDLEELEDSVANQGALSLALEELAKELSAPARNDWAVQDIDEELRRQIGRATAELQRLNLRYSILVQHSSRSAAQMAALFNSVRGQFQEGSGPRLKHQTWSCRV